MERQRKVLITGAAGFTGHYLSDVLTAEGWQVHGMVGHRPFGVSPSVAFWHEADLLDRSAVAAVVEAVQPSAVVHLAAISFVAHGDADLVYRTNVIGTRNLLEALKLAALPALSGVLVASSANVYGNATDGQLSEHAPAAPVNDYAVSKIAMEYVCRLYQSDLPVVVVRPFNYTGIGQAESFLVPKIVAHFKRRASKIELGNLDVARDFSDVRDVALTYARLLQTPTSVGGTFNVCSGRAWSLREIIDALEALSGHALKVEVNPAFVRANEVKTLIGDRRQLESVIGPSSLIPFDQTLQWMLSGAL